MNTTSTIVRRSPPPFDTPALARPPARQSAWWLPALATLAGCGGAGVPNVSLEEASLSAFVAESAATTLEVRNDGDGDLTFIEFVFTETPSLGSGPQFHVTPYLREQILEPAESLEFHVVFTPLEVGSATADIVVSTSAGKVTARVAGEGIDNPPVVLFPENTPETICLGESLTLTATVSDVEDAGDLSVLETSLASSLEGVLGEGTLLPGGTFEAEVVLTVEGRHTITLEVTDSHGKAGRDTIDIDVLSPGAAPEGESGCSEPAP